MIEIKKNLHLSNEQLLKLLESYLEVNLPNNYRDFLLENNGGKPAPNFFYFKNSSEKSSIRYFFGLVNESNMNLLDKIKMYNIRIPNNTFPIAKDELGNLILLSVKNPDRGKVYFWDHELEADPEQGEVPDYSNLTLIADSFEEFINGLQSSENISE